MSTETQLEKFKTDMSVFRQCLQNASFGLKFQMQCVEHMKKKMIKLSEELEEMKGK